MMSLMYHDYVKEYSVTSYLCTYLKSVMNEMVKMLFGMSVSVATCTGRKIREWYPCLGSNPRSLCQNCFQIFTK